MFNTLFLFQGFVAFHYRCSATLNSIQNGQTKADCHDYIGQSNHNKDVSQRNIGEIAAQCPPLSHKVVSKSKKPAQISVIPHSCTVRDGRSNKTTQRCCQDTDFSDFIIFILQYNDIWQEQYQNGVKGQGHCIGKGCNACRCKKYIFHVFLGCPILLQTKEKRCHG